MVTCINRRGIVSLTGLSSQIDNIARKCEIIRILENRKETIDEIKSFCREETFDRLIVSTIGFRKQENNN